MHPVIQNVINELELGSDKIRIDMENFDSLDSFEVAPLLDYIQIKKPNITVFSIRETNVCSNGLVQVVKELFSIDTCTDLYLETRDLAREGAMMLSEYIQKTETLRYVSIHDESIDNEGASILAEALANNISIRQFTLSSWIVNSYLPFAKAIAQNRSLEIIWLGCQTPFTPTVQECEAFQNAMRCNHSLFLFYPSIGLDISSFLERNRKIILNIQDVKERVQTLFDIGILYCDSANKRMECITTELEYIWTFIKRIIQSKCTK
jgi:hypothetical protein